MKWVHPDLSHHARGNDAIDRTVFASRVTGAWEDLKTDDRRHAYDARTPQPPRRYDRQRAPRVPWIPTRTSAPPGSASLPQSEASPRQYRRRSRFGQVIRSMTRSR
jgi:hypothetical protein